MLFIWQDVDWQACWFVTGFTCTVFPVGLAHSTLNVLLSCAAAQDRRVWCASGDVYMGAEGVSFLMTRRAPDIWACDPLLVAVCVCVSLFLTLLFLCVFQEKADTSLNSSEIRSDIQVSRPTMRCISAFRPSHTCSHHYTTQHFHSRPLSDKSADCILKLHWFVYHQRLKSKCVCVCNCSN